MRASRFLSIIALACVGASVPVTPANSQVVIGRVVDASTGQPIPVAGSTPDIVRPQPSYMGDTPVVRGELPRLGFVAVVAWALAARGEDNVHAGIDWPDAWDVVSGDLTRGMSSPVT